MLLVCRSGSDGRNDKRWQRPSHHEGRSGRCRADGGGIAYVCALAGYDVLLNDLTHENIESRLATINGNLARQVAAGK